jgi:hypothetical protein
MTSHFRVPLATSLLLIVVSFRLEGQFNTLEKVLSKVESVNFFYLYAGFEPRSTVLTTSDPSQIPNQSGLNGFGFEVSIGVGETLGRPDSTRCRAYRRKPAPDSLAKRTDTLVTATDTLEITTDLPGSGVNSQPVATHVKTKPRAKEPCRLRERTASYELAVGYSQLTGFKAQDTSFQLYGSLRELPAVAFYATLNPDKPVNFYAGVRAGLAELHSLRAYDTTNVVYVGNATTFQAGLAVGVVAEIGPLELFLEPSYNIRRFPSIEWTPVTNMVPERFPRELQMSSWQFAVGFQVDVTPDKAGAQKTE